MLRYLFHWQVTQHKEALQWIHNDRPDLKPYKLNVSLVNDTKEYNENF